MVRRRNANVVVSGEVPEALLNRDAPEWRSSRSAAAWFVSHGLVLKKHPDWWVAASFHHEAVCRWAVANGFGQVRYPKLPDWGRLREAGVPPSGARFAWLSQAQVE